MQGIHESSDGAQDHVRDYSDGCAADCGAGDDHLKTEAPAAAFARASIWPSIGTLLAGCPTSGPVRCANCPPKKLG